MEDEDAWLAAEAHVAGDDEMWAEDEEAGAAGRGEAAAGGLDSDASDADDGGGGGGGGGAGRRGAPGPAPRVQAFPAALGGAAAGRAAGGAADTTAAQAAAGGRDPQGIPWHLTEFTRASYRAHRNAAYRADAAYFNRAGAVAAGARALAAAATRGAEAPGGPFFAFARNWAGVRSSVVHFQLRNLCWPVSARRVLLVEGNRVRSWDGAARSLATLADASGRMPGAQLPGLGAVQVCTLCARGGLWAAGGFQGELLAGRLDGDDGAGGAAVGAGGGAPPSPNAGVLCARRVTSAENGITNALEMLPGPCGAPAGVVCSNNDAAVRVVDAETFATAAAVPLPWAVNFSAPAPPAAPGGGRGPGGATLLCVGDDPTAAVVDARAGRAALALRGHLDFSFAAAWHPGGAVVATGNQDLTTRVWDLRAPKAPVALLAARLGAPRSLRYSPDGRFLAVAEPADYATVYDVASGYRRRQTVDVFGELSGLGFTPCGGRLYLAVADRHYSSLLQFDRAPPAAAAAAGRAGRGGGGGTWGFPRAT